MKAIIFFVLIVISLVSSIAVVAAQSSATNLVALSPTTLSFVGGQTQLNRTLTFVGITNQTVNVTLVPTDLYDNNTGKTLSANDIEITPLTFNVTVTDNQTNVNISLNASQTQGGTYQGTILVITKIYNSTTNNLQINATNIYVSAIIQPGISFFFEPQYLLIILIVVLELAAFLYPDEWRFKKFFVVLFGGSVLILWVSILLIYGFSPINSILSTIGTIVIIPFFAWVINYLNEKRTTENEKEKSSRTIENEGNASDIELVRNVLGELETHFASFKPNFYGKSKADLRILYNESGIISRKVWDASCRQGVMSDLPLFELAIYYDLVNIYNRYYSCAIELTKDKNEPLAKDSTSFLESFEVFRSDYAELETVLFINLSFYMGLFIKTNLSPLPIEFPRITRPLLNRLIDYKILDTGKYPGNFKYPSGLHDFIWYSKEFFETYSRRKKEDEIFEEDFENEYKEEKFGKELKEDRLSKEEMEVEFKKKVESGDFDLWIERKTPEEIAKRRIHEWHMSARGLENVVNEIYHRDNVPRFYKAVRDDFRTKFNKLEMSVGNLPPLPREFLKKEKNSSMKETKTIKELSEVLGA